MRAVVVVVGSTYVAGIMVTVASGVAARLFFAWLGDRLGHTAAWAALGLLFLYPYAFFMYGAVYPTALFVAALLGAFLLLERGHPWLAGVAGALGHRGLAQHLSR
jgi:hypothetical protein